MKEHNDFILVIMLQVVVSLNKIATTENLTDILTKFVLKYVWYCISEVLWKNLNFFFQINMFLMFSDHFDVLMSKIIF